MCKVPAEGLGSATLLPLAASTLLAVTGPAGESLDAGTLLLETDKHDSVWLIQLARTGGIAAMALAYGACSRTAGTHWPHPEDRAGAGTGLLHEQIGQLVEGPDTCSSVHSTEDPRGDARHSGQPGSDGVPRTCFHLSRPPSSVMGSRLSVERPMVVVCLSHQR